jgi:hypothetical protein
MTKDNVWAMTSPHHCDRFAKRTFRTRSKAWDHWIKYWKKRGENDVRRETLIARMKADGWRVVKVHIKEGWE